MRNFFVRFFRNIVWIYVSLLMCFSYSLFMKEIPNRIYVTKGQDIEACFRVPVTISEKKELSLTNTNGKWQYNEHLDDACDYIVTCKLFGILPVKEVEVKEIQKQTLYAGGHVVGIYGETEGVLVLATDEVLAIDGMKYAPAENRIQAGDYILAVDGKEIDSKEELASCVENYDGNDPMVFRIHRKGESIEVAVTPVLSDAKPQKYLLGIWVKDDMAGIGTLSYYTADGRFGALGHGIGDGETGQLLDLSEGKLYQADILGIEKGARGTPGELKGIVYYGKKNQIGCITGNDKLGIYGTLDEEDLTAYLNADTPYEMAYKQEIELGEAYLLSDISGQLEAYTVNITSVDYQAEDSNKGIHFQVTDEALLAQTGGIVQGMSGSTLIQNGKMIGAVTHVLVNDPTKGYGIFIENMIEH